MDMLQLSQINKGLKSLGQSLTILTTKSGYGSSIFIYMMCINYRLHFTCRVSKLKVICYGCHSLLSIDPQ